MVWSDDESYHPSDDGSDSEWVLSDDEDDVGVEVAPITHISPIHDVDDMGHKLLTPKHHNYTGIDLAMTTPVDTRTQGCIDMFLFPPNGSEVVRTLPKQRFSCSHDGPSLLIRSTCLSSFPQHSHGNIIVYRHRGSNTWNFGIVKAQMYRQLGDVSNLIVLYKWVGKVDGSGVPDLFYASNWDDMQPLVEEVTLRLNSIEMFFVNVVRTFYFYIH